MVGGYHILDGNNDISQPNNLFQRQVLLTVDAQINFLNDFNLKSIQVITCG